MKSIVSTIPGGWYGTDPGYLPESPKIGHVAVNPAKSHLSVDYLRRKIHAKITAIEVIDEPSGHSLLIRYTIR